MTYGSTQGNFWAAVPKGTKSCRTQGDFRSSVRSFVHPFVYQAPQASNLASQASNSASQASNLASQSSNPASLASNLASQD